MKRAGIILILAYKSIVSPYWPGVCRYTPTCSSHARKMIEEFGLWKGGILALRRLLLCNPFIGYVQNLKSRLKVKDLKGYTRFRNGETL
jgi:putative membrane protein insertion efficiency factor